MQDNTTSLLFRQLQFLDRKDVLVVNPVDDLPALLHDEGMNVRSWYLHAGRYAKAPADVNPVLEPWLTESQDVSQVIVILPKEKALVAMIMRNLAAVLPVSTPLLMVGHKDTGIKSQLNTEYGNWSPFEKLASGNHCQLLRTSLAEQTPWQPEQELSSYTLDTPHGELPIHSFPGVFSPNRLDDGTALLMQHIPSGVRGNILDFGCGTGVISRWLMAQDPHLKITLSDVSPLAIESAKATLKSQSPAHCTFKLSDGLQDIQGQFDWIITNPPFHTGKQTDYSITNSFIKKLPEHLTSNGRLVLVANSFLPYKSWLEEQFRHVQVLFRNKRFCVYQAHSAYAGQSNRRKR